MALDDAGSIDIGSPAPTASESAPAAAPVDRGSPSDQLIAGHPAEATPDPEAAKQALRANQMAALKAVRDGTDDGTLEEAKTPEEKVRDERGRWKAKDGAPPTEGEAPVGEAETPPAFVAPRTLPPEVAAAWKDLPPIAQEYAAWTEDQMHKARSRIGRDQAVIEQYKPFGEIVNQFRGQFEARDEHPVDAIADLLDFRGLLDSDPGAAIVELIQSNRHAVDPRSLAHQVIQALGIDPWDVLDPSNQPQQEDPQVAALKRELAELRQATSQVSEKFTRAEQQEMQYRQQQEMLYRQQAAQQAVVAQFAQEFPDVADLDEGMSKHLTALQRTNPGLSLDAKLARAYHAAKADAQKAALSKDQGREAEYVDAARKAASQNVRGTPVASTNQPTSVRSAQQAALAQARARSAASPSF